MALGVSPTLSLAFRVVLAKLSSIFSNCDIHTHHQPGKLEQTVRTRREIMLSLCSWLSESTCPGATDAAALGAAADLALRFLTKLFIVESRTINWSKRNTGELSKPHWTLQSLSACAPCG